MKEILKSFPKTDSSIFGIQLCGTSYCDGTYLINRPRSRVHCFEYVIKGSGTIVTSKGKLHPKEGDVYFLRAGDDHYYYSDADNPWIKIWFNVRGSLIDSLTEQYGVSDIRLFNNCRALNLFEEFVSNVSSGMDRKSIENQNAVIIHKIIQCMAECIYKNDSRYSEDAITLRDFIDSNYNRQVRIEELGALIYRSPSQTIRIFKKNFGIAPYEYALRRKMQAACQLLKDTRMPIREIAGSLGFSNEHYFSSCFKSHMGITPGKYRKQ